MLEVFVLRRLLIVAAFFLPIVVAGGQAGAQSNSPVRLVVPFAAGGTNDAFARLLADKMQARLNRPVIVDNRPGAGGLLASKHVISSPPDGNTLLLTTPSAVIQSARVDGAFDISKELVPVIMSYYGAHALYVNASLPIYSVADLIQFAKKNPGQVFFASFGVGSQVHLAMELLNALSEAGLVHVPYRSNAETILSVTKGETQVSFEPYMTLKGHVEKGTLRPLAVTSLQRDANAPSLPSIDEAGVPGFNIIYWSGIHAPRGTAPEIIATYNKVLNEILQEPDAIALMQRLGVQVVGGPPERFSKSIDTDLSALRKLIRERNITF